MAAVQVEQRLWDGVLELTKAAQEKGMDPLMWAMQLSSNLTAAGISMPSTEVAELLVSYICWSNNVPIAWKFLEKALTIRIVPPMFVIALLSTRVIANRRRYPVAYRLYMELLKRYAFSLPSLTNGPNYQKIMESINVVLHYSQIFEIQSSEPGLLVVEFIFSIVWELLDASLDDEGLLELTSEKKSRWLTRSQDMEIDNLDSFDGKRIERQDAMHKMNTITALEIIGEFFRNKVTSRILYLARRNMPAHWEYFIRNLRLLASNSSSLRNSKHISPEALLQLTADTRQLLSRKCKTSLQQQFHAVTTETPVSSSGQCHGVGRSALWLTIDLYLEDTMDGSQVAATSAAETLTGLVKALQALNQTTWQDAFLGLWIAALRLVQRERNSSEGPVPRLDTCLCMLLSITTLAVVNIIEEDEISLISEAERSSISQRKDVQSVGKRRQDLFSSLQQLDDFEGLLIPPPPVSSLANQAAAKAMVFLSGLTVSGGHLDGMSLNDMPVNCSGNLRHLIVEACIARNVLDTSAYMWPGYVKGRCNQVPRSVSGQMPGWSSLMKGSPLTPPMVSALVSTPASSLAELEKMYEIAITGSDDEKMSAATIFCGASLTREYLLLVRNSQLASYENPLKDKNKIKRPSRFSSPSSREPIFMDSFPKLKSWYRQHQECIASILSGLVPGTPVHHIVEALLNFMFRKINRGGQPLTPTTSGSSTSSVSGADDSCLRLKLPAWDILEAVPFVLDASLTACAHGRLSPRELTTGLKDLADFLPASLATIVSYFSAEVTRGLWKPAFMNGTDWPSPAANLSWVEQQINKILAATGVDVPCLALGVNSPATIPLPLAALVSLTITYKLDRVTDRFLNLVGPALTHLGTCCPWPCMSIIAALWTQKVKRWGDFLVFSAARTVFHHNTDAVVQLLRVCFSTALGLNSSVASNGGVGALLGHGFGSHFEGGISAVAPGILYLRVHRAVRNVMFMTEEIVSLLLHTVKDIATRGLPAEKLEKLKKTKFSSKYGQVSLASAMTQVKVAASLGASLVWMTGGLSLVQSLIKETLPSRFISVHGSEPNGEDSGGMIAMLGGYALAYFAVFSGIFAWGVDMTPAASKHRPKVLGKHFEFLASTLEGKISLGCNKATWKAYVTGFVSLMVGCTPMWMLEVDVQVLKSVSKGLKQWNEEELAVALLGISGINAMGAAAEMIIETGF
ncbi:unnamed protein product [Fraxinus pennsylvanica]|uniref:Mediator of RNA polymerase II transcription subunit 33A n=1 Tax=Fraxinus pennsylvanica TaxID=56036 RepID=A0AAD2A3V0_9LAMI|nr:unnamed protein product [Fraxinus pennsylvanica]